MIDSRGALRSYLKYGLLIGLLLGLVGGGGLLVVLPDAPETTQQQQRACVSPANEVGWNSSQPATADPIQTLSGSETMSTGNESSVRVQFRAERKRNSSVLPGVSHDNVLLRADEKTYLLSQYHCAHLLETDGERIPQSGGWETNRTDVFYEVKPPGTSIDTMLRAEDRWYAYAQGAVFVSDSLTGDWTAYRLPEHLDDAGVYYEDQTFHMFYEAGNTTGLSGSAIGHATSSDGVSNWTEGQPVYESENGFKTGDYDVIEQDGIYLIFADHTRVHPNYTVSLFATESLSSNFTHVGTVARPFRNDTAQPERGIQDATVRYDPTREAYVLYTHVHEERRRLHSSTLTIDVENVSQAGSR
ncbi:glycoside hydrolase family protein [Halosimplex salinum]|uniref:hypothetical protein n=1 Tax=Halosimplex salinum TaxID=1710538 RepID=UPI000F4619CD|nr:hypothetical protein [Halosimplex salinum]